MHGLHLMRWQKFAKPDSKTPDMALTVHVDIVKRTGLAISRIFLVTTPLLILQLKKNKKKKGRGGGSKKKK